MASWHADRLIGPGIAVLSVAFLTLSSVAVLPPTPSPSTASIASAGPTLSPSPSLSELPSQTPIATPPEEPLPLPPLATPSPIRTSVPPVPPTRPPPTPFLVTCANGVDNSGGLGLICDVTILNIGFATTVTLRECHGAAGDPEAACTTKVTVLTDAVITVDQCNGSANGGGATLRCSVRVIGGSGTATVNQCVGSGGGITAGCSPFPANVSGATITQCNGSANGGTLVGLSCTAGGSSSVVVNQCNGSGNGGGALVICSAET